jgi:hypothetical protein
MSQSRSIPRKKRSQKLCRKNHIEGQESWKSLSAWIKGKEEEQFS